MGQSPITSHCDVLLFSFLFIKNQYFHSTHPSVRRTTGATDIYIYFTIPQLSTWEPWDRWRFFLTDRNTHTSGNTVLELEFIQCLVKEDLSNEFCSSMSRQVMDNHDSWAEHNRHVPPLGYQNSTLLDHRHCVLHSSLLFAAVHQVDNTSTKRALSNS